MKRRNSERNVKNVKRKKRAFGLPTTAKRNVANVVSVVGVGRYSPYLARSITDGSSARTGVG